MQIILEINESIWQAALAKHNAAGESKAEVANAESLRRHSAVMAQTPVARRTAFVPTTFTPLDLSAFVDASVREIESGFQAAQTREHLAAIAQQTPEEIARLARVTSFPQAVKDELAAQVDALANTPAAE